MQPTGTSIKKLKNQNCMLILKMIATYGPISRIELTNRTGLTKMTISNQVNELIKLGYIQETNTNIDSSATTGRKPSMLVISDTSPCICGMLIKRGLCQTILADLSGKIIAQDSYSFYNEIDSHWLVNTLLLLFNNLKKETDRKIVGIGISSVGPLNSHTKTILKPPFFYNIENVPIGDIISSSTNLPVFLINDANAGALAEKLYGIGRDKKDFTYLHIMNGIGAGFVLNNNLYDGSSGQSGEVGHTSINFSGPRCACGNIGCLDLYANVNRMQLKIKELSILYPHSTIGDIAAPSWDEILSAADGNDPLALIAIEEFCTYICYALTNVLNLLNLYTIIVGYDYSGHYYTLEKVLLQKLSLDSTASPSPYEVPNIVHSHFSGNAPLIGAIAVVAEQIFNSTLILDDLSF